METATKPKYAGSEWIAKQLTIPDMSPLGVAVADALGEVYLGIYHLHVKTLVKVDWRQTDRIEVSIYGELCTIDFDHLTRLVVVAHDRLLRVAIRGIAPNYLRLTFTQRGREGVFWERCPTLEDHAKSLHQPPGMAREDKGDDGYANAKMWILRQG